MLFWFMGVSELITTQREEDSSLAPFGFLLKIELAELVLRLQFWLAKLWLDSGRFQNKLCKKWLIKIKTK